MSRIAVFRHRTRMPRRRQWFGESANIAIRGGTSASNEASGAALPSVTLTGARQPQAGDRLIIFHQNNFYLLSNMSTPTVGGSSTGVTAITNGTADAGTNGAHIKSYTYNVGSTGDLTVAAVETGAADEEKVLAVYVLKNVDQTTAIDVAANATATSDPDSQDAPSVSPASANAFLICAVNTGGGTDSGAYLPPPGMDEMYDLHPAGAMAASGAVVQLQASGATGAKLFDPTTGSQPYAAISIAVKTASAGGATVDLEPAALALSANALTPVPGMVTISLGPATLNLLALPPAGFAKPIEPASLVLEARPLTFSKPIAPATLVLTAQPLTFSKSLAPATLVLEARPLTPVPGMVTVTLAPATLALSAQALSPSPSANLNPATLVLEARSLTPVPGMVTVTLAPAILALSGRPLTFTKDLAPATLALEARPLTPVPGMVTISLAPAVLVLSGEPLAPQGVGVIALAPATLPLTAQPLTPVPGPVTVSLGTAVIPLTALPLSPVAAGASVGIGPATLVLAARALSPVPGPVSTSLLPAVLSLLSVDLFPIVTPPPPLGRTPDVTVDIARSIATTDLGRRTVRVDIPEDEDVADLRRPTVRVSIERGL
jgi:hypothetical protein